MTRQDPNLAKIELIAAALGPLSDRLVFVASHDLEDIINVVDGRQGLVDEISGATQDLREYLRNRFADLLAAPNFIDLLPGMIFPDESHAERTQLVAEKIRLLAGQKSG